MNFKTLFLVIILLICLGVIVSSKELVFPDTEDIRISIDLINASGLWEESGTNLQPQTGPDTLDLRVPTLTNCDSIDTDASGVMSCGTDATGAEADPTKWKVYNFSLAYDDITARFSYVNLSTMGSYNINTSGSLNVSGNVTFTSLKNCNTIDTDANGLLTCGDDGGGATAGAWDWTNNDSLVLDNNTIIRTHNRSFVLEMLDNSTINRSIDLSNYISDASAYQKIAVAWNLANNDTSATLTQLGLNITRGDLITPDNISWIHSNEQNPTNATIDHDATLNFEREEHFRIDGWCGTEPGCDIYHNSYDCIFIGECTWYQGHSLYNESIMLAVNTTWVGWVMQNDTINRSVMLGDYVLTTDISGYDTSPTDDFDFNNNMSVLLDNATINRSVMLTGYISDASSYQKIADAFNWINNLSALMDNATINRSIDLTNYYTQAEADTADADTIFDSETMDIVNQTMFDNKSIIRQDNRSWVLEMLDNATVNRSIDLSSYIADGSLYQKVDAAFNWADNLSKLMNNLTIIRNHNRSWVLEMLDNSTINRSVSLTGYNKSVMLTDYNKSITCAGLTGSADLCDGDDATGAGGDTSLLDIVNQSMLDNDTVIRTHNRSFVLEMLDNATVNRSVMLTDYNKSVMLTGYNKSITCAGLTGSAGLCDGEDNTGGVPDTSDYWHQSNASEYYDGRTDRWSIINYTALEDKAFQLLNFTIIYDAITSRWKSINFTQAFLIQLGFNITRGDLITPNNESWISQTVNNTYPNLDIDSTDDLDLPALENDTVIRTGNTTWRDEATITESQISDLQHVTNGSIDHDATLNFDQTEHFTYESIQGGLFDFANNLTYLLDNTTINRSIDLSSYISDASSYQKIADAWDFVNNASLVLDNNTIIRTHNRSWVLEMLDNSTVNRSVMLTDYLTASPFGADISSAELTSEDFGEFDCDGSAQGCTIASGVIDADNIGVDAVGDSELFGGGAWTLNTADLNIDSNTLVIDKDNDLVGIGTATPSSTLEIAGNLTATGTGNSTIGTFAILMYNASCSGFRFGSTGGLILSCE